MTDVERTQQHKGRGAVSNRESRFDALNAVLFDDGWGTLNLEPEPIPKTTVTDDHTRSIISTNQSPDIPFDQSINPYKGCEHGCIYCYARPSHSYLGLSPGLDFETKLFRKTDAAELLEKAFRKKHYQVKTITIGANTDAYQPIERENRITRQLLEVMQRYHHPVAIITKSALVLRDLDILAEMAAKNLAMVAVSVTTLDPGLSRILEPRAAAPHRRIDAIRELSAAGVPVLVNAAPMIPAINDAELEKILEASRQAGAVFASYILVRLPLEVRDLFVEWLQTHFPDRCDHVMNLIRQTRDGADYKSGFGQRMKGTGVYAELLRKRFYVARDRLGFKKRFENLRTDLFRLPPRAGDQMSLFD